MSKRFIRYATWICVLTSLTTAFIDTIHVSKAEAEEELQEVTQEVEQIQLEAAQKRLVLVNIKLEDPEQVLLESGEGELRRLQNLQTTLLARIHASEVKEEDKLEAFLKKNCSPELHDKSGTLRELGSSYNLKPEVIVAIAWADSKCGRSLTTANNYGNVGNNDRGNRRTFSSIDSGLEAIAQTVNNGYHAHKQTIGSLSPGGGGICPCYATSPVNWDFNTRWALTEMMGYEVTRDFNIRTQ